MNCRKAQEELSAYVDDMLLPEEKKELEQHIAACGSCKLQLAQLRLYAKTMAGLPKVKAPGDFLKKVNERIARRSDFESVIRGFFKPSANKTRAGAVLVTIVAVFAIYKVVALQFSVFKGEPAKVARLEQKADSAGGSGITYEEQYKMPAPVAVESAVAPVTAESALAPAADTMQLAARQEFTAGRAVSMEKAAMPEASAPIRIHAKLNAIDPDGSAVSLERAIDMITLNVLDASGLMKEVIKAVDNQARFKFTIPADAYSPFVKGLEQIAAVQAPDSSSVRGSGSIDVDLTLSDH
jgi:anti-sigma factor RsiW